mgnify:CR=1 FL=1
MYNTFSVVQPVAGQLRLATVAAGAAPGRTATGYRYVWSHPVENDLEVMLPPIVLSVTVTCAGSVSDGSAFVRVRA